MHELEAVRNVKMRDQEIMDIERSAQFQAERQKKNSSPRELY